MFGLKTVTRKARNAAIFVGVVLLAVNVVVILVLQKTDSLSLGVLGLASFALILNFFSDKRSGRTDLEVAIKNLERENQRLREGKININALRLTPKIISLEASYTLWDFQRIELERWEGDCWNEYLGIVRYQFTAHYGVDLDGVSVREHGNAVEIFGFRATQQGVTDEVVDPKLREIRTFAKGGLFGNERVFKLDQQHSRLLDLADKQVADLKQRAKGGKDLEPVLKAAEITSQRFLALLLSQSGKSAQFVDGRTPTDAQPILGYFGSRGIETAHTDHPTIEATALPING
jgi:hypothetical protein